MRKQNMFPANSNDLYSTLRPLLIIGKILGVLRIDGLRQRDFRNLNFRKISTTSFVPILAGSLVLVGAAMCLVAVALNPGFNEIQDIWLVTSCVYYLTGALIFVYFHGYGFKIKEIIESWNSLKLHFTSNDASLFRDANLIVAVVIASALLDCLLWIIFSASKASQILGLKKNDTEGTAVEFTHVLETYYQETFPLWARLLPAYTPVVIYAFISHEFVRFFWIFMDLTIVIFARGIYFKFQALTEQAELVLMSPEAVQDGKFWRQVAKDHQSLRLVLEKINGFLSPLVLLSCGANIFWISIYILFRQATPGVETVGALFKNWAPLIVFGRILLVSIASAKVHHSAHSITHTFNKCADEAYIPEVERAEHFINAHSLGFSALNCFTITQQLILQIIGVIFTFEVVLLQASKSPE